MDFINILLNNRNAENIDSVNQGVPKFELQNNKRDILLKKGKEKISEIQTLRHSGEVSLSLNDKDTIHNTQQEIANNLNWSSGKTAQAEQVWKKSVSHEIPIKVQKAEQLQSNESNTLKAKCNEYDTLKENLHTIKVNELNDYKKKSDYSDYLKRNELKVKSDESDTIKRNPSPTRNKFNLDGIEFGLNWFELSI